MLEAPPGPPFVVAPRQDQIVRRIARGVLRWDHGSLSTSGLSVGGEVVDRTLDDQLKRDVSCSRDLGRRTALRVRGPLQSSRGMSGAEEEQWSPARDPYAIAVSQSWWAMQALQQFAADTATSDGPAQQIYARQVFGQLRHLRRCATMLLRELHRLGVEQAHREQLQDEIDEFERAVPGATDARDLLEHSDAYARGDGRLQRRAMRELGIGAFEAAAMFWGGGYDSRTETITEGPFSVQIPQALQASERLYRAIYIAARAVDEMRGSA